MADPADNGVADRVVAPLGQAEKAGFQKVLLRVEELGNKEIKKTTSLLRDPTNGRDFTGEVVDLMGRPGQNLILTVPGTMTKMDIYDDLLRVNDRAEKVRGRIVVPSTARSGQ